MAGLGSQRGWKAGRSLARQGDLCFSWARGNIGVASRKAAGRAQMKSGRQRLPETLPARLLALYHLSQTGEHMLLR